MESFETADFTRSILESGAALFLQQ
jgi:hypothetical protein